MVPDEGTVRKLHLIAASKQPARTMPLGDLERLLQRVSDESDAVVPGPTTGIVAGARGEASAPLALRTGASPGAPVPGAMGDRRNRSMSDPYWPVDELRLHLESGRYEHAIGMLDYAGDEAPAVESAAAIQACRSQGLTEATDALLRKVGRRPEKFILAVVGYLLDAENTTDARALTLICDGVRET
ncbi:hypothetical protein [Actinomadura sediminis]|uniref:Uncharacterized protein n=1 Tax=Actinomadura sediminis TaxID=1038904 RepID=A0ABW3EY78_9ACTN